MKNLVIVDTIGDTNTMHSAFKARFPFIKAWHTHQCSAFMGNAQHPHGGMAFEKAAMPLWNANFDVAAHFVQIFRADGSPIEDSLFEGWLMDTLEAIRRTGLTWVNNSWGAYMGAQPPLNSMKRQADAWRELIGRGGIYVAWAAGNSGDYSPDEDRDYPQSLLTDVSDKIGAADRSGRPSSYSGDSRTAPPLGVYWATNVLLANPNTGRADRGSGTSFAAPKHVGLMMKRGIMTRDEINQFRTRAVRPPSVPASMIPHPKWGEGWFEDEYQAEIRGCPYLQDAIDRSDVDVSLSQAQTEWFDFRQVNRPEHGDILLK